jgi:hypothetical protein
MNDQIIDVVMAQALQTDVARTRPIAGWVEEHAPGEADPGGRHLRRTDL